MALYAFDGTGNEDRGVDEHGNDLDSNVLEFFRGYSDPNKNDDRKRDTGSLYLKGIGTLAHSRLGEGISKAFGVGGHKRIRWAMERLENNFEIGDVEIDIVGFSRGAALAMSFANKLAEEYPDVDVRFIGVWDIVGEFGAPGKHVNAGHKLGLTDNVGACYHAMAMHETRLLFPLTRLGRDGHSNTRLQEVWFQGVHSDVGGGNGNPGLNWISLDWMYENALSHGLPITQKAIDANRSDGKDRAQQVSKNKIDARVADRDPWSTDVWHPSAKPVSNG